MSLVDMQHADRRWFALYRDFDLENFAVSHEKEIYIVDYEELSIIENVDFDEALGKNILYLYMESLIGSFDFCLLIVWV